MLRRIFSPFGLVSATGVVLGALCFMAALTPSLVPRSGILQGVLAGLSFAAGYGVGVILSYLWRVLHLPQASEKTQMRVYLAALAFGAVIVLWGLWAAAGWQGSVRAVMGLGPVETVRPFTIAGVAAAVAAVLLALGRLFWLAVKAGSRAVVRFVPERVALIFGLLAALAIFNFIGSDLILSRGFAAFDQIYAQLDSNLTEAGDPPSDPLQTGSAASKIEWTELGAEGRNFIARAPDAAEIQSVMGDEALAPLRVYVGLGAGGTAQERAALALEEAIRIGAFERRALVLATPTGTGWMDPAAHYPLEMLLQGDVATLAMQYSYLPSWASLLTVPEYGAESARALFQAVHGYWRALPPETRPALYLFGLSLGARNTDLSADFYDLINDPYAGAFMVGPPFTTRSWQQITLQREKGTPEWLPQFRGGEVVRFMGQHDLPQGTLDWSQTRMLFLQYASDPIVFFAPSILWSQPDWMKEPRGADVSARLRWVPIVTFLQIGFDLLTATSTPRGYGHVYAGEDYMLGWQALLGLELSASQSDALKDALHGRGL